MLLTGKTILIVEDNVQNRVVYHITLRVQGANLDFDRSGDEAVARLKRMEHCDLIILDLMLKDGVSGFDAFQRIREMPRYAQIPIVAVSASDSAVALPRARALGFSGYISKPIDEALFPKQIAQIIAGEQVWFDGVMLYPGPKQEGSVSV